MKILAFDVSKSNTGQAFTDGTLDGITSFPFKDSKQWEQTVKEAIKTWKPDIVVYSDTVFFRCGHRVKKNLYGLMFLLEHICFKMGVQVHPIGDREAKKACGVTGSRREEIKKQTMEKYPEAKNDDEADACSFAEYSYNFFK